MAALEESIGYLFRIGTDQEASKDADKLKELAAAAAPVGAFAVRTLAQSLDRSQFAFLASLYPSPSLPSLTVDMPPVRKVKVSICE